MSGVENEKQKSLLRPAMVEGKDYGYFRGLTHGVLVGLAIAVMLCALLSENFSQCGIPTEPGTRSSRRAISE